MAVRVRYVPWLAHAATQRSIAAVHSDGYGAACDIRALVLSLSLSQKVSGRVRYRMGGSFERDAAALRLALNDAHKTPH